MLYQRYFLRMNQSNTAHIVSLLLGLVLTLAAVQIVFATIVKTPLNSPISSSIISSSSILPSIELIHRNNLTGNDTTKNTISHLNDSNFEAGVDMENVQHLKTKRHKRKKRMLQRIFKRNLNSTINRNLDNRINETETEWIPEIMDLNIWKSKEFALTTTFLYLMLVLGVCATVYGCRDFQLKKKFH